MSKAKRLIFPVTAAVSACVLAVVFIFVISPNSQITKRRESFEIKAPENKISGDCIHFLPTGSSDCILLQSGDKFALVDCAEDNDNPRNFEALVAKGWEDEILEYLKNNAADKDGKVHLDFVIGTHSHSDHIGGFDTIIADKDVEIGRAYLKEYDESKIDEMEVREWDNKEVYQQMVDALNKKNVPIISDIIETEFKLGNFNIKLFNTEYDTSGNKVGENDNAIGTLVEKAGVKVFLAADIDNKSGDENKIGPELGKINVLKVGHHSYSGSTTTNWLKTLDPEVCIITNDYEKTDKRTLRRITRTTDATILTTGAESGVILQIDDNGEISYFNRMH